MAQRDASRPLRIALVPPLWARVAPGTAGGVEYTVHLLAEELVRRGHAVTVFTSADSPVSANLVSVSECSLIEAMERGRAWEYEYYETCNIAEALRRSGSFDVVHFHVGGYAIPWGEFSRAPVLHTLHNPVTPDAIWLLERYPDAAVTGVGRNQIVVIPEPRRRSIRVIHNACNFEAYQFSSEPGKFLAFLGRMGPGKGPHEAIRIAKRARMPIVLAGQPLDEAERVYFSECVQPHINGRDVIYLGQVEQSEKNVFLRDAAALLFPIQADEAFGLVMIEAMACGTPVVALQRSSVDEVVDFGVTGFYGNSVEELAALVPHALRLDRTTIRACAQKRFSRSRMADEYMQAYHELLGFQQGGRPAVRMRLQTEGI